MTQDRRYVCGCTVRRYGEAIDISRGVYSAFIEKQVGGMLPWMLELLKKMIQCWVVWQTPVNPMSILYIYPPSLCTTYSR